MRANCRPVLSVSNRGLRAGLWVGVGLVCLVTLVPAQAQQAERPWSLSLAQNVTHESNVLGSARGAERSDTVATSTLAAGLDLMLGRQRAYANASFNHQRFQSLKERDNNGYALASGLDLSSAEQLAASVKFNANQRQADFNVGGVTPVSVSNIERSEELTASVSLGGRGLLGLDLGGGQRQVSFTAPEYASREYSQDSARFGLVLRPSALLALSLGLGGDHTRFAAAAPGQTAAERSRRRDVYGAAQWVPSGLSTVNLRLATSRVRYERATAGDFDGLTGSLAWTWRPLGKLALTSTLTRDSGQESGFLRLSSANPVSATDFSQLSQSQGLRINHEWTGKVSMNAGLVWTQRRFVDGSTGVNSSDKTQSASWGLRWAATRTFSMTCSVLHEARKSSSNNLPSYSNDRFGCSGQLGLD